MSATTLEEETRMATTDTVIATVPLGEDREIRISRIEADEIELVRIAPFLIATDSPVSGIIFPRRVLGDLIAALRETQRQLGDRK